MVNEIKINNIEEVIPALEKFAEWNLPIISIENDGIGSYEFWGAKGFDKGNTYHVVDSDINFPMKIDVSNFTEDDLEELLEGLDGETVYIYNDEVELSKKYKKLAGIDTISFEYKLVVSNFNVVGEDGRMNVYFDADWK